MQRLKLNEYKKGITAKEPWVSEEITRKMGEKKKWRNIATSECKEEYRQLNNELRRETDKAREVMERKMWRSGKVRKGRPDLLYNKVRLLTEHDGRRNSGSDRKR